MRCTFINCAKTNEWFQKERWIFKLSKGWCVFLLFGTAFDFYCHLGYDEVALVRIFLIREWITVGISCRVVWLGELDQYLASWLDLMQHTYCFKAAKGKYFSVQIKLLSFCLCSFSTLCDQGSDVRREFNSYNILFCTTILEQHLTIFLLCCPSSHSV